MLRGHDIPPMDYETSRIADLHRHDVYNAPVTSVRWHQCAGATSLTNAAHLPARSGEQQMGENSSGRCACWISECGAWPWGDQRLFGMRAQKHSSRPT